MKKIFVLLFLLFSSNTYATLDIPGAKTTLETDETTFTLTYKFTSLPPSIHSKLLYEIPNYSNSKIDIDFNDKTRETTLKLIIAKADLTNSILDGLKEMSLPGGRALPGLAKGKLPAEIVTVENFEEMVLYNNSKTGLFGVFVPFKNVGGTTVLTDKFFMGTTRVGNISAVGKDTSNQHAGILLLLNIGSIKATQN
jgi:hypothetical protein